MFHPGRSLILYERLEEDCVRRDWCLQAFIATSRREESARRYTRRGNELEGVTELGQGIGDFGTCV